MSYYLFLDDERLPQSVTWVDLPAPPEWVIARTYTQFVAIIQKQGMPAFVTFDHDLDSESGVVDAHKTGMDCARWLVEHCMDTGEVLPAYQVHSYNSVGKQNILGLLDGYARFCRQQGLEDGAASASETVSKPRF